MTVTKVADNTYITPAPPYPSEGIFLLDENANVLDKNAESYPVGTIKAYGFKAGDGNYYAVDAEAILDLKYWGGYNKLINNILTTDDEKEARLDYAGDSNTTEIITQLKDYNDGYATGAPAAEACRARTFNGKQGFLPALGQFNDFCSHKSEIDSLATKFSLDVFQTDYHHWTSTQILSVYIYSGQLLWSNGGLGGGLRDERKRVRAFFAL